MTDPKNKDEIVSKLREAWHSAADGAGLLATTEAWGLAEHIQEDIDEMLELMGVEAEIDHDTYNGRI